MFDFQYNFETLIPQIFDNHFHFHHNHVSRRSVTPARAHHGQLEADARVRWARQQKALSRKKRDFQPLHETASTGTTRKK